MKVLLINSVCGICSTGRIVTDLVRKYMEEGHECRIAFGRSYIPPEYEKISYRISSHFDVIANALKARVFDNDGFNSTQATKRFLFWAEEFDPDILWLHNLHGYYINVALLFDWIKSRPRMEVRWTLHDCWAFTGHCAHFSFVKCEQWKTGCERCTQTKEYPKSWVIDNCKENFRKKRSAFCNVGNMHLITPSEWLAGLVKDSFLKNYPVQVAHNTIDTNIFKPTDSDFRKEHGLEGKTVLLGVASAWSARKGLPDFIRLAQQLDDSYKVVLVGVTKRQIKQIPDDILCIERTDSACELAEIYTSADIFVNLTYEDTYPTVNLEAQACGTPCITYRTGGSPETIRNGYVAAQGDLSEIIKMIHTLAGKKANENIIFRNDM